MRGSTNLSKRVQVSEVWSFLEAVLEMLFASSHMLQQNAE